MGEPRVPPRSLGRALEALFEPGSLDDRLGVAEAQAGTEGAVLVPELVETGVEPLQLFDGRRVVPHRQPPVELGAAVARALDLLVDLVQVHIPFNVRQILEIPSAATVKQEGQNREQTHDSGRHGDRDEEVVDHS